jgi:RND family efflux transporter MFP subunit
MQNSNSKIDKKQHPKKWWLLIGGVSFLAIGAAIYFFLFNGDIPFVKQDDTYTTYQTANVLQRDIRVSINGSGTLITKKSYDLKFSSQGVVTELNVKLGEKVNAGEVLVKQGNSITLEANIASSELNVLEAQKTLDTLKQNADLTLAKAYQDWINAQEDFDTALTNYQKSSYSRCSQEVNVNYMTSIEKATEQMEKAEEGSDLWIILKDRYDTALANYTYCNSYTQTEIEEFSAKNDLAQANLNQSEKTYNDLKENSGIDPYELQIAEAKLTEAQASLEKAKEDLEGNTLISPIDGVVTYLAAEEGALVDTSLFITISDLTNPMIEVNIDESDLSKFTNGSMVEVVFDAMEDLLFTGKLTEINPNLITTNNVQTVQGVITLDTLNTVDFETIPLGLNASVELVFSEEKNATVCPVQAIHDLEDGEYAVFVKENDGKLRLRLIELGLSDSTYTQVTSGLNPGDVVSTGILPSY